MQHACKFCNIRSLTLVSFKPFGCMLDMLMFIINMLNILINATVVSTESAKNGLT